VIAPLPVAFIGDRGGVCLWIPWFGWALWIAHQRSLKRICQPGTLPCRVCRKSMPGDSPLADRCLGWNYTDYQNRENGSLLPGIRTSTSGLLKEQLEIHLPKVKPGAQIAFYNDGVESWDAKFITELFFFTIDALRLRLHATSLSPEEF